MSEDLETTVYRLVQEALTNVAKHARASRVRVAVAESDGELLVEVQDDGAALTPSSRATASGWPGCASAWALAGGTLSIDSGEQGTARQAPACRRSSGRRGQAIRRRAGRVVARSAPVRPAWRARACGGCARGGSRPCGGEMQLAGDLDARVPERDQSQDFDLARRESVVGERAVQRIQACGDARADELLATCCGANRLRQLAVGAAPSQRTRARPRRTRAARTPGSPPSSSRTICVSGARSRSWLIASMLDPSGHVQIEHEHVRLVAHERRGSRSRCRLLRRSLRRRPRRRAAAAGCGASAHGRLPGRPVSAEPSRRGRLPCRRAVDLRP